MNDIAQWVAVIVMAIVLVVGLYKSNQQQTKEKTEWKTSVTSQINSINERLDDDYSGLKAIKKALDEQKMYCIKVSTGLVGRVGVLERGKAKGRNKSAEAG